MIWTEAEWFANCRVQQSDGRIARSVSAEMGRRGYLRKILDETIEITKIGSSRDGEEPLERLYDQAWELHIKLQTSQVRDTFVWSIRAGEGPPGPAGASAAWSASGAIGPYSADDNGSEAAVYECSSESPSPSPKCWGIRSPSSSAS